MKIKKIRNEIGYKVDRISLEIRCIIIFDLNKVWNQLYWSFSSIILEQINKDVTK